MPTERRFTPHRTMMTLVAGLLAVGLQVVMPLVMLRVMAAAFDPFSHATICSADPTDPAPTGDAPAHSHGNACPICLTTAPAHATLPPAPVLPPVRVAAMVRLTPEPSQSVGPRGPPHERPPSRAPPASLA